MAKLDLIDLTKIYTDFTAVDHINLSIAHGEFVCLLGPSGCGKTTTLRLIAGFLDADDGEIRVGERVISAKSSTVPPERRNMSMIFQSYAVWPHMTVTDNVAYGLKMKRVAKNEVRTKVRTLLEATQLQALAERYPSELSGGQQQRISLARALAPEPEILLLDEPLSNLDANLREEMRFEIRQLHNKFQYTTVYVTHDQIEAMAMADRIVVMNRGHIEQIGTPEDIYERPESEFVAQFIGGTNILKGTYRGDCCFDAETFQLDLGGGDTPALGEPMSLSIRFHELELSSSSGEARRNVVPGQIIDQAYMGSYRDYLVDIGVKKLKITAPASLNMSPGERVSVRFPPERCRGLMR